MRRINSNGVSLIEMIVVVGLIGMFVLGVGSILTSSLQSRKIIWEQLSTQEEGRKIIQDLTTEIRGACYSGIGAYPLEIATSSEIAFYSNVDSDSAIERVHYKLIGKELKKSIVNPTGDPPTYVTSSEVYTAVAHDVYSTTTPIFTFYDSSYDGTGNAMTSTIFIPFVRVVGIKLQLEERPNFSPAPFNIEAKALMRNLKDN